MTWTAMETKILDLLSDGQTHLREELLACIDEQATYNNLAIHLTNIRKKLPPGHLILCVLDRRRIAYRKVRSIASPYDGRR